jgi:anti-sigma B factor antagonist
VYRDGVEGREFVVVGPEELDVATAPSLRTELDDLPATSSVVIDLRGTRFMDSSGLNVLIQTHRRLSAEGGTVRVLPSDPARRVLDITDLADRFGIS